MPPKGVYTCRKCRAQFNIKETKLIQIKGKNYCENCAASLLSSELSESEKVEKPKATKSKTSKPKTPKSKNTDSETIKTEPKTTEPKIIKTKTTKTTKAKTKVAEEVESKVKAESKTVEAEPKVKIEKTEAEKKQSEDYKQLSDYLYNLCNKERAVFGLLIKQVKRITTMDKCEYKYSGILATLRYVFEMSENPPKFNPQYGIEFLVISNYYGAQKFYERLRELYKQDVNTIDEILQAPEIEVHVNQNIMEYRRELLTNKRKDKIYGPMIDLDSIEDDEEDEEEEIDEEV